MIETYYIDHYKKSKILQKRANIRQCKTTIYFTYIKEIYNQQASM